MGVRVQAHAENLHAQSFQTVSQPAHMQASVKAQSLATHAQSLEAQAEAQNLQAQAHVHAHAHAEAQAQAQHLAAQAQAHAQAQATANAHATHLKSAASFGKQIVQHLGVNTMQLPQHDCDVNKCHVMLPCKTRHLVQDQLS